MFLVQPKGEIPLGRIRRRREHNIKTELGKKVGGCGWVHTAQGNGQYWALVNTAVKPGVSQRRAIC